MDFRNHRSDFFQYIVALILPRATGAYTLSLVGLFVRKTSRSQLILLFRLKIAILMTIF